MSTTPTSTPPETKPKDTTKERLIALRRVNITLSKLEPADALRVIESARTIYTSQTEQA